MAGTESSAGTRPFNRHVLVGIAIMLLGLAVLAGRFDGWPPLPGSWWPFLLLFLGTARILYPAECNGRPASRGGAFWLIAVGGWGLISEARLFGFDYSTSWPLLIIAAGVIMVWRAFEEPAAGRSRHAN